MNLIAGIFVLALGAALGVIASYFLRGITVDTWIAILIGAVGTWIIALVAVGDRLIGPRLRVGKGDFSGTMGQHAAGCWARYYLVPVSNTRRRFRKAHKVQLVITRIEKSGEQGRHNIFDEIMPVSWIRQELYTVLTRTVGPNQHAALFFIQENGLLSLTPMLTPTGQLPSHFPKDHNGPTTLWITLQAISDEADSSPICLKISWNGEWRKDKLGLENVCSVTVE
jgi:hypothetical protein